jgi:formylglycine-generating enzyme required for sulfatase activity
LVDITYDVAADFPTVSVSLQVSSNGGSTFVVPATTLSGAIGAGVATGTAKKITWDAGADWSGQYSTQMRFKVIADDGNTAPTISDIAAQTITEGNNTGALAFTVGDAQSAAGSLTLSGSSSNTTLVPNANIVFGGSGANRTVTVTPASSQTGTATITVTVSDGSLSTCDVFVLAANSYVPTGMVLIPAGAFTMGNSMTADTDIGDAATRTVTLDAYYMGKYEVSKSEWDEVRTWGLSNGYTDLAAGSGKAYNHPVQTITWYEMVKWCNARSQKEGLTPVYYTNDAQTTIYKTGDVGVTNAQVNWTASGYRLPTEAEWETAARGGLSGKRFPWGDTISHSQANYYASSSYTYDVSGSVNNYHPTYAMGSTPYTSPVGAFAANGYGLYDMAGNVWEWCWDWYGHDASGSQTNPRGATSGTSRVHRGGGYHIKANTSRVAHRSRSGPAYSSVHFGFRVVRTDVSASMYPRISDIAAQTTTQDSSTGVIAFTIGDAQTGASLLTLNGSSSNTTLIPNANIVFGGSGAYRTVTVTPASSQTGTATITVTVSDGSLSTSDTFVLTVNPGVPSGFSLIPAGNFTMGNVMVEDTEMLPSQIVYVSAFFMGQNLVTRTEWDAVRTWGMVNGYTDLAVGSGKESNHPVHTISWYDMVKWCNARSQKEGFTPVYYTNSAQTAIYKTGNVDVLDYLVKWNANGYRLPTEAEWEKAARGGFSGRRFPWGDTISHSQANYYASSSYSYDLSSSVNNHHPIYKTGSQPYTSPVGAFAANGFGLYDMVGNIWQRCWDLGGEINLKPLRQVRGGVWNGDASLCRVAYRASSYSSESSIYLGFRVVRSLAP